MRLFLPLILLLALLTSACSLLGPQPKDGDKPVWEPITWPEAIELIQSGDIVKVDESHSGTVKLTSSRGDRYITQEPELGDVMNIIMSLDPALRQKISVSME